MNLEQRVRKKWYSDELIKQIRGLYAEGYSSIEIEKTTGVSHQTILNYCRDIARKNSDRTAHRRRKEKNEYCINGDNAIISLNKNKETIIDSSELDRVLSHPYRWYINNSGYVVSTDAENYRKTIHLHRLILPPSDGKVVDHINRDRLDNRMKNLRVVTQQENLQNTTATNRFGVTGIYLDKRRKNAKYVVRLTIDGKSTHIGQYENLDKAKLAVHEAKKKHYKGYVG